MAFPADTEVLGGGPGGAPTAAEAQSSVRGMPAGMSVPVKREVGRSPDH